ncbi:hypothetical protein Tco_0570118 [Tanacetum coccineum]
MIWVIKDFEARRLMKNTREIVRLEFENLSKILMNGAAKFEKKEQAYNEEKYSAARRQMLFITFDDEDDYSPLGDIIARYSTSKAITPDLPTEEPDNLLNMGDEHLSTIPATELDEVIKSSVENLVPIPSEFEGISEDTSDVPNCDNNRINVESDLVESLINRDTSIVYSSKIDLILEEFSGELAHIAPIPLGIVEADFDPNDDTSSDDDDFEDIEYVILEEVNDVDQEEKDFDLEDIFQIQDSPSSNPIYVTDSYSFLEKSDTSLSHLDNSLPKFETSSDHTEETRSGSTTTHANYSLPEYGYIRNHKKTAKNGQTRTRETEEHKRSQRSNQSPGTSQVSVNQKVKPLVKVKQSKSSI